VIKFDHIALGPTALLRALSPDVCSDLDSVGVRVRQGGSKVPIADIPTSSSTAFAMAVTGGAG
jgi:hypothetical protein